MRLTRQRIHQLPLKATIYLVRDGGASSLVVQVFPQGRKVYQVRVRIGDKIKTRTLGTVHGNRNNSADPTITRR